MGGACGASGGVEKLHGGLVGKSEGQETNWNTKRRWEVDVKVSVKGRVEGPSTGVIRLRIEAGGGVM
jgi:hypothetical protein